MNTKSNCSVITKETTLLLYEFRKKQELVCNIGPILLVVLWHTLYYQGDLS